jgi:transposase-like protein
MWRAAAANQSHGLRRSNADKIRSVEMVLTISSTETMSDREIARRIGVSHEFVRQHRMREEEGSESVDETDEESEGVDGDDDASENAADEPIVEAKKKYAEIISMIDDVRAALAVLSADPAGYSVNWNAIDADIKNAKRCLTDAKPHDLCVYCNGDGCDACKHTGWLGKVAIEMAPKNLKKGRK